MLEFRIPKLENDRKEASQCLVTCAAACFVLTENIWSCMLANASMLLAIFNRQRRRRRRRRQQQQQQQQQEQEQKRALHFFHHPMMTTTTTETLHHRQHPLLLPPTEPKATLSRDFFCFHAPADIDEEDDADVAQDASSLWWT